MINRPKNIKEVSMLILDNIDKKLVIGDFLDEFRLNPSLSALNEEPVRIDLITDAKLAAIAEMLALKNNMKVPEWTQKPERFLNDWFIPEQIRNPKLIELLKNEAQAPFAKRKLAVSANAYERS